VLCDKLGWGFEGFVRNLSDWKKNGQRDPRAIKVINDVLPNCLLTCHTQLPWLVSHLRKKGQIQGEEKVRHVDWLNQRTNSEILSEQQIAEIKNAIIKGRLHKAKKEEVYAQRAIVTGRPNVLEAAKPSAASSSSHTWLPSYPSAPTYAPPAVLLDASQGTT
jgi:hypothetical protein